ncbi:MAG: cation:dicarboxylase symporter family transporter [Alphaproteobacteria bacterium]|nr:cation:dicarboxylase symporter family transporter [Alphaproteobacteria bacterium]
MHIKNLIEKTLESKLAFLGAIIIGGFIGVFFHGVAEALGYLSEIFIDVMKMCVLPIIVSSLILSVSHFTLALQSNNVLGIIFKLFLMLGFCSILGMTVPSILGTGQSLDPGTSQELKEIIEKSAQVTLAMDEPLEKFNQSALLTLFLDLIPENIFSAFAKNSVLSIVVFSIIFGIFLGKYTRPDSEISNVLQQVKETFFHIFGALEFLAPIILMCIVAKDAAELGPDTLIGLADFVVHFYIMVFLLIVILGIGMMLYMRMSFWDWYMIIREPLIIAFATQSSAAAIPTSITAMTRFRYAQEFAQLMIPLGSIIGRFGNILYFSFCTIFAAHVFQVELSLSSYGLILVLSTMAGISTTGQVGTLSVSLLSVVLTPLGIPFESLYPVLVAIESLIDPGRTMVTVHANCALVSFLRKPDPLQKSVA